MTQTPATAQDALTVLLREHVGPRLRALGFKGSGASWTADRPGWLVSLGFQRSVHGTALDTEFTVNVAVASIEGWNARRQAEPYLPVRPAPNTRYGPSVWHRRIGALQPGGQDRWWAITPRTGLASLAGEVTAAIADHALPAIEEHIASAAEETRT